MQEYPEAKTELIDEDLIFEMDTIIKINTLALSAREKAQIKVRQPLNKLIISPEDEPMAKAIKRFDSILKKNLNIKKVEFLPISEKCPVEYQIKPNMKKLGPKFGAKSRFVAEIIKNQAEEITQKIKRNEKELHFAIDGEELTFEFDDLHINEIDPPNLAISQFNKSWLAIETIIYKELEIEGIMRDFVRQIQVLRKNIGLELEDRIKISFNTDSEIVAEALKTHHTYICKELLCVELSKKDSCNFEHTIEVRKNLNVNLNIQKAL